MESPVEIRYAGVVIGRAQEIRGGEGDSSFFLAVRDPMPVGSVVHLRTGDRETPARVIHTVESADAAAAGIQVRLIGEAEEVATEWIPAPAPAEKARPAEDPPKTAMPVIEVAIPVAPAKVAVGVDTRLRSEGKAEAQQTDFAFEAAPASEAAPVPEAAPEAAPAEAAPAAEAAAVSASEPVAAVVVEEAPVVATAPYGQIAADAATPSSTEASDGVVQAPIEHKLVDANDSAAPAEAVPAPAAPAASEDVSPVGDLPPARPIAGPSGRRKTKRRR
jgi:hypothetical protein